MNEPPWVRFLAHKSAKIEKTPQGVELFRLVTSRGMSLRDRFTNEPYSFTSTETDQKKNPPNGEFLFWWPHGESNPDCKDENLVS